MRWKWEREAVMAVLVEDVELTSRASLRILGESGRKERDEGLRAVATRRWPLEMTSEARALPMPEEHPVTFLRGPS